MLKFFFESHFSIVEVVAMVITIQAAVENPWWLLLLLPISVMVEIAKQEVERL